MSGVFFCVDVKMDVKPLVELTLEVHGINAGWLAAGKGMIKSSGGGNPAPKYLPSQVILLKINSWGY